MKYIILVIIALLVTVIGYKTGYKNGEEYQYLRTKFEFGPRLSSSEGYLPGNNECLNNVPVPNHLRN